MPPMLLGIAMGYERDRHVVGIADQREQAFAGGARLCRAHYEIPSLYQFSPEMISLGWDCYCFPMLLQINGLDRVSPHRHRRDRPTAFRPRCRTAAASASDACPYFGGKIGRGSH